jgi:CRISPR-associated protein Cas2
MTFLFCYDIADSRRRTRISKELERFGLRIQKSFFQCDVAPALANEIKNSLLDLINKKEDSLIVYPLCSDCLGKVRLIGNGTMLQETAFEIL